MFATTSTNLLRKIEGSYHGSALRQGCCLYAHSCKGACICWYMMRGRARQTDRKKEKTEKERK